MEGFHRDSHILYVVNFEQTENTITYTTVSQYEANTCFLQ